MKTKKPLHLHVEHFSRKKAVLIGMLSLLGLALVKADSKALAVMQDAYFHGYGMVGEYMREETSRVPVTFEIAARTPTHSGH